VNLVWKINSYRDFLIPIEHIIDKYCRILNPAVVSSAVQRKGYSIIEELKQLITDIAKTNGKIVIFSNIYLTVILNIILKLCTKQINTEQVNLNNTNIVFSNYKVLFDLLKTYSIHEYKIMINDDSGNLIISQLDIIIKNTNSEKELIEFYENNY
jgi:hypothetical protein